MARKRISAKKIKRITVTLSARCSKALREFRADEIAYERSKPHPIRFPNYRQLVENALWTFWKKWETLPTGNDAKALKTLGRRP